MNFVYFLKSLTNDKYYIGSTSKDPLIRVNEHNNGSNSWTKANGPFKLIFYESYLCKEDARKREAFYKSGLGRRIRKAIIEELSR